MENDKHMADSWNFYKEREFLENLLQTRFNFLLISYSLILSAYFSTCSQADRQIIAVIGIVLIFALWMTVLRIYYKVELILKYLYKQESAYKHKETNDENYIYGVLQTTKEGMNNQVLVFPTKGVNSLIGIWIPIILCGSLTFLLVL